ncbi:hypothetical protein GCM10022215_08000 [Nocardioides fonticola]|uniref:Uncharacterized protein n=1 Tax=Nocardioides fonticola TaxID=450363 RepID=A0ABP7XDF5_9ACTN
MNLLSMPVFGASALATAPTLWQGLVLGTMPMETMLTRFGLVMVGAWLALSVIEALIGSTGPALGSPPRGIPGADPSAPPPGGDDRPA